MNLRSCYIWSGWFEKGDQVCAQSRNQQKQKSLQKYAV